MTPAGTSNELDVQNEGEVNTHTHTHTIHDCSLNPVFCFLYSKILPVTKMRLNVCFNEMALFGPFVALIKGCSSYGRNGGQPTQEEVANPQGMKVFTVERPELPEDFVSFSALCGVQSSPLVFAPNLPFIRGPLQW